MKSTQEILKGAICCLKTATCYDCPYFDVNDINDECEQHLIEDLGHLLEDTGIKTEIDTSPTKTNVEAEAVCHPSHYNIGNYEVINVIEDWNLNFSRGNAVKYLARAGHKNPDKELEDLEKAAWYLNREIERLKDNKAQASDVSTLIHERLS